jgi:hypothetical protein
MSTRPTVETKSTQKLIPERRDFMALLMVCVFITHFWSIINFLHEIPSFIQQQTIGEIVGVFSYVQTLVLIETLIVFVFIILITFLLPKRIILTKFLPQASLLVIITSLWVIPIHFHDQIIYKFSIDARRYLIFLSSLMVTYAVTIIGTSILLHRNSNFEAGLLSFINKVVTASILYLSLDIVAIVVIILRIIIQVNQ